MGNLFLLDECEEDEEDETIRVCGQCSSLVWFINYDGTLECPNCGFVCSDMHVDILEGAPH